MKKNVSLKDIAHAVGVSTALVSYVLNGKQKKARVGPETAKIIFAKAKEMNYVPNQIAKSLKSGKSQTIGLIVADISNPFFSNLARTIEDEAKKDNYTVIFGSSDENGEKQRDLIDVFIKRQVDGFIIAPTANSDNQIQHLENLHFPLVLIDRYFPAIDSNFVVTDNYEASFNAINHLLENGFKKIALITYKSNLIHMQERKKGYLQALSDKDIKAEKQLIKEINYQNIQEDIEIQLTSLLKDKNAVDAVLFATNTLALSGLKYLNAKNYRIPKDLALVCFDESDAFDLFYSPLTCVYQPLGKVGDEAVKILLDQMEGNNSEKKHVFLKTSLIIRASSTP